MTDDGILDRVQALQRWLTAAALPLWRDAGFDHHLDLFHERMDFDGRPLSAVPRRLMVQCRQVYVYAEATLLGWVDGGDLAVRAFRKMVAAFHRADGQPGWVFSIGPDGRVADRRRDLYAHAFVLLACVGVIRLTQDLAVVALADETLAMLDEDFALPGGGYLDGLPDDGMLRQNPHMHLFEGLLALFEATGAERYLDRASRIYGLMAKRFFIPRLDILAEYFDREWRPASADHGGYDAVIWEPGHHCEWVWLLDKYARLSGVPIDPIAAALYARAYRDGIGPDGMIADEMRGDGRIAKSSRRAWPLTEAIKANAVRYGQGDPEGERRAGQAIKVLMRDFLTEGGLWRDHLAADGEPFHAYVPASTLYHVVVAASEAARVFGVTGTPRVGFP